MLYQPTLSDILPMYCIFLLFTPIVLDQMMKGRAWLVGVISISLWCAAQWGIGDTSFVVPWIRLGSFNILAWQAYFVAGQYLGYRSLRGEKAWFRNHAACWWSVSRLRCFFSWTVTAKGFSGLLPC